MLFRNCCLDIKWTIFDYKKNILGAILNLCYQLTTGLIILYIVYQDVVYKTHRIHIHEWNWPAQCSWFFLKLAVCRDSVNGNQWLVAHRNRHVEIPWKIEAKCVPLPPKFCSYFQQYQPQGNVSPHLILQVAMPLYYVRLLKSSRCFKDRLPFLL